MKAYLEKFGHESQLGTDFEAASAALADFMYQVRVACGTVGPQSYALKGKCQSAAQSVNC